ncbi:RimI Acetyltransferases [Comamonadaceae bacterium]
MSFVALAWFAWSLSQTRSIYWQIATNNWPPIHRPNIMTITLRIERATLAQLDTVASLFDAYRQFYEQAPNLTTARGFIADRMQRNESTILLAYDAQGLAVGFCQMYASFCSVVAAPIVVLYDLFVSPAARKTGAGRALLLAARTHAESHGFARMDLTTAKTNTTAQALYRSLGWVKDDVFDAYNLPLNA